MLCLARKVGESFVIAGQIKVMVISTKGKQGIRLGISAPKDIRVDREEVYLKRMTSGIDDTLDLLERQKHNG